MVYVADATADWEWPGAVAIAFTVSVELTRKALVYFVEAVVGVVPSVV